MKIIKRFQGQAPENKILNYISESETDGYSCAIINGMSIPIDAIIDYDGDEVPEGYEEVPDPNVFSTTEKVVGTWIDGRTLYQRTWTYTTTEADTRYYLAAYGLTDIKDVWIVDSASYVRYGTGNGASTQSVNTWVSSTDYKLCYIDANGKIVMRTGTGGSTNALNWVITLRYTRV